MPKYKVKSNVTHGTKDPDGSSVFKDYTAGSEVEMSEDEARAIAPALENPPDPYKDLSGEEKAAVESIQNRPDNPDSGVMLPWQLDGLTKATYGMGLGGLSPLPERRPEQNKTKMELADQEKIETAERQATEKSLRSSAPTRESVIVEEGSSKTPAGEPRPKQPRPEPK